MDRPPIGDVWIPRLVVAFLGLVAMASGIGATVLAVNKEEIPPFLAGLGTAAVSTLGMLAAVLYAKPGSNGSNGGNGGDG